MNKIETDFEKLNHYQDIETYYPPLDDIKDFLYELFGDRVESQKYIVRTNKKLEKLQSNWNSLKEIIKDCNKRYEDSNIELNDTYKYYLNSPLPPRYTMNLGAIELIDYLLDKMNELEGKNKDE